MTGNGITLHISSNELSTDSDSVSLLAESVTLCLCVGVFFFLEDYVGLYCSMRRLKINLTSSTPVQNQGG